MTQTDTTAYPGPLPYQRGSRPAHSCPVNNIKHDVLGMTAPSRAK